MKINNSKIKNKKLNHSNIKQNYMSKVNKNRFKKLNKTQNYNKWRETKITQTLSLKINNFKY